MKKNVQVIDGAINSTFEVYEVDIELFDILFPNGNDIAFVSDFPNLEDSDFYERFYSKMVNKKKVKGIHGTPHLDDIAKESFPNRRETDAGKFFR
ncbi:hypothetical protein HFZ78_19295 [Priestia megaterium]|uniref:Uncharacterized protein n=1 Tax=Priestia megaterium TaxID=1404 RepID=A0A6H1P587_PRIMG|nr:hypothetical protein [Priestia megaterium]QIZ08592.1 hypothetical protein HFZ78_19295 [Priestia megaterium]